MLEDADENLWVGHHRTDPELPQVWSVFRPDGAWLGEVHLPAGLELMAIGREEILASSRDDLDVSYVHLYSLRK